MLSKDEGCSVLLHMYIRLREQKDNRLKHTITTYSARHSWASIAYRKEVPLSVISEGMGHNSEKMTRIYLSSLDNAAIDRANCVVWEDLI